MSNMSKKNIINRIIFRKILYTKDKNIELKIQDERRYICCICIFFSCKKGGLKCKKNY